MEAKFLKLRRLQQFPAPVCPLTTSRGQGWAISRWSRTREAFKMTPVFSLYCRSKPVSDALCSSSDILLEKLPGFSFTMWLRFKKKKKQIKKVTVLLINYQITSKIKVKKKKHLKWHLCVLHQKGGTNGSDWPHSSNKLLPQLPRRIRKTRDRRERVRPTQSLHCTRRCDHRTALSGPEAAKSWCWTYVGGRQWSPSSVSYTSSMTSMRMVLGPVKIRLLTVR